MDLCCVVANVSSLSGKLLVRAERGSSYLKVMHRFIEVQHLTKRSHLTFYCGTKPY